MTRTRKLLLLTISFLLFSTSIKAQLWKKIKQKAEDAVVNKVDKEVNSALNKKKQKNKKTDVNKKNQSDKKAVNSKSKNTSKQTSELYRNFKFIPGEKVIFYDNLKFEETGEFPSKWDLLEGGSEIAILNKEKVIIPTTEDINVIHPLFENQNYLGDEFTIEFDIFIDNLNDDDDEQKFGLYFDADDKEFKEARGSMGGYSNPDVKFEVKGNRGLNGIIYKDITSSYDAFRLEEITTKNLHLNNWNHVSISYYKKKLKIYFNQKRILNLPNYKKRMNGFAIQLQKPHDYNDAAKFLGRNSLKTAIKNIRIAHGGGQMYKRIMSSGKYVTNGILFDSGKATIQPQSMGVINKFVTIMNEKPDWKFEIIGHTDTDGDEAKNLKLSSERAESVKNILIKLGIDAQRLTTIGKGESEPLHANNTTEEKANNRRVEFIKK